METTTQNTNDLDLTASEGELTDFGTRSYLPDTDDVELDLDHEIEPTEELPELANEEHLEIEAPEASMGGLVTEHVVKPTNEIEKPNVALANLTDSQLTQIKNLIIRIEENTQQIKNIIEPYATGNAELKVKFSQASVTPTDKETDGEVIEGVFDGQLMIGPDGHEYTVPANYASKSRLVEGDILKLIITRSGAFIFKQIQPIDRRRITGLLEETETGDFFVMAEDRRWHVLSASVTYYKGESGDQAVIVVPKIGLSKWAAVENIIKR